MNQEQPSNSSESIHATFENEAVGMAFISPDGRWLRVNAKLCRITGYSDEELLERSVADITHPDDVEAALDQLQRVQQGKARSYTIEKRYIRKDVSVVSVRKSVSLVRAHEDAAPYFIAVIDDITRARWPRPNSPSRNTRSTSPPSSPSPTTRSSSPARAATFH